VSHIALLIPGLDRIGGAERQVILLAKGLRMRGWRVSDVALSGTGGSAASEVRATGAAFLSLGMCKGLADPRGWFRMHNWLRRECPDVVHAHLPHAAWLARWSRLFTPVPVVVDTLHSSSTGSLGRRLGYCWSNWLPDQVTAVSQAVADTHMAASMVTTKKLIMLPNGVDVEMWQPNLSVRTRIRRELGLGSEFLWLSVGRLEPVKDYPTLLRALALTPHDARLVIAGGGPLEGELVRMVAGMGLENRVRFLGFEPDVLRWMQAADGFVLSSVWEGLPMVLLEAAACALPAVATDIPGTREVMADGHSGWLTTPVDATALAGAMNRMIQLPPEERRAMGERARQGIIERYSLEAVLDRWEALYRDLLKQSGARDAGAAF
jgi:glycosyltransferase involved in cell wall biosynthesis